MFKYGSKIIFGQRVNERKINQFRCLEAIDVMFSLVSVFLKLHDQS